MQRYSTRNDLSSIEFDVPSEQTWNDEEVSSILITPLMPLQDNEWEIFLDSADNVSLHELLESRIDAFLHILLQESSRRNTILEHGWNWNEDFDKGSITITIPTAHRQAFVTYLQTHASIIKFAA